MSEIRKIKTRLAALTAEVEALERRELSTKPEQGRWWIGDDASTDEVIAKVRELISDRECTLREISKLTGVPPQIVSRAIVRLQVNGVPVQNLGTKRRARWSIR